MKVLAILVLLFAAALAFSEKEYQDAFTNFMIRYNKNYAHSEFFNRYNSFKKNMDFVLTHNNRKDVTHTVAINKFADLTNVEFGVLFAGVRVPENYVHAQTYFPNNTKALPTSLDWRTKGAVTPIKNQGQCGSCWSFSTTGSVEGCHFITTQKLVSLSEKNLMDCSWNQGNEGCNGGLMTSSFQYIISNKGIDTEAYYPYSPVDSHTCKYTVANRGSTLGSYSNVQSGSETALQNAVNEGPTSVAIDASHSSFQLYSSGVYYEASCSSSQLDHGVLAIGWGVDAGKDFWLVKNSWGTDWGLSGFINMSRNRSNNCGIATMASLPKTCQD